MPRHRARLLPTSRRRMPSLAELCPARPDRREVSADFPGSTDTSMPWGGCEAAAGRAAPPASTSAPRPQRRGRPPVPRDSLRPVPARPPFWRNGALLGERRGARPAAYIGRAAANPRHTRQRDMPLSRRGRPATRALRRRGRPSTAERPRSLRPCWRPQCRWPARPAGRTARAVSGGWLPPALCPRHRAAACSPLISAVQAPSTFPADSPRNAPPNRSSAAEGAGAAVAPNRPRAPTWPHDGPRVQD